MDLPYGRLLRPQFRVRDPCRPFLPEGQNVPARPGKRVGLGGIVVSGAPAARRPRRPVPRAEAFVDPQAASNQCRRGPSAGLEADPDARPSSLGLAHGWAESQSRGPYPKSEGPRMCLKPNEHGRPIIVPRPPSARRYTNSASSAVSPPLGPVNDRLSSLGGPRPWFPRTRSSGGTWTPDEPVPTFGACFSAGDGRIDRH